MLRFIAMPQAYVSVIADYLADSFAHKTAKRHLTLQSGQVAARNSIRSVSHRGSSLPYRASSLRAFLLIRCPFSIELKHREVSPRWVHRRQVRNRALGNTVPLWNKTAHGQVWADRPPDIQRFC